MDIGTIIVSGLFSIVFAILTYIAVNRIGEWQERKMYSRLGVAIIESLQEEIQNGIDLMTKALDATKNMTNPQPPRAQLPSNSWDGMSTISDDVLLRIIETSKNRKYVGPFRPSDCRIHCKNYFTYMCPAYKEHLDSYGELAAVGRDWRTPLRKLLVEGEQPFIQRTTEVFQMLEQTKKFLADNSKAKFPK